MLVLHAHWKPSSASKRLNSSETAGVLFWAETSEIPGLSWQRGRLPKNLKPRPHPFCAQTHEVQELLEDAMREYTGGKSCSQSGLVTLYLPTSRSGPLASPALRHGWEIDQESMPTLCPWIVSGAWLPVREALPFLISIPSLEENQHKLPQQVRLGDDARTWHTASALALEALAGQKIVPALVQVDEKGQVFEARWMPVLDSPRDAQRLAVLQKAMPPLCRATIEQPSPRHLISTFLNQVVDTLARTWAKPLLPSLLGAQDELPDRWLKGLYRDNPTIKATPAQLQALASGVKAWMRSLSAAGDGTFRISFRLEAPDQQIETAKANAWKLHYLLQSQDDPSLLVPAETVWKTSSSVLSQLNHRFEKPQEKLLAGLGYAARLFSPIMGSLKRKSPTHLDLDTPQAYSFLREAAPLLESSGFGLLIPPWWNQKGSRLGVRLHLKPSQKQGKTETGLKSKLSMNSLVDYQWELSIGETTLSAEEFYALAELKSPLVQIRGQWVTLDAEQVEAAIHFWEKQNIGGEMNLLEALQMGVGAQTSVGNLPVDEVVTEGWVSEWLERLTHPDRLTELPQPELLLGKLRPYQRYGYSWLAFLRRYGLGACLADDMGLGKTIQTIALLLREKQLLGSLPAPTLLVCPTSVVTNWQRELQRFAPSLTALLHQGPSRLRGDEFCQAAQSVDMVLTSYALVRQDADAIQSLNWWGLILDEAQNIKNPTARQTQSVRKLQADFRLALTGTPVENRLSELWSIMHFLNPGYLGSQQSFRQNYALPVERYADQQAAGRLKQLIKPFILRRVKTDPNVIQDLPEKMEMKDYCHLTEEQATLYEAVVQEVMQKIESSEGIQRRGLVLTLLMQLKQICNHPMQYLHQSGKVEGKDPAALADGLNREPNLAGRSGKLERLVEMLEEILDEGDRALIFTQFAEMGHLLASYLPGAVGNSALFLHGGVPAKARDGMVKRFQEDENAPSLFILSLKAGGTGLNLTRANHVFHYDRWWNPAVENQATDRAFRIGQKRNVQVHKFVTIGTMEEMIDDLIESKKELAQSVIGGGEQWLTELSTAELRDMVRLRR